MVRFANVLPETVMGELTASIKPMTCCADAAAPVVVTWMLFAVALLPTTLVETVATPPVICSALTLGLSVPDPVPVSDPTVLPETVTVPAAVPDALTPTINAPVVVTFVRTIAPVPVPLPTVFVEMLAEPPSRLIPVSVPVAPDVVRLIAVIVLPVMLF